MDRDGAPDLDEITRLIQEQIEREKEMTNVPRPNVFDEATGMDE